MKKYPMIDDVEKAKKMRQLHNQLSLFQSLLESAPELDKMYLGRAAEIAERLQPWIDALELMQQRKGT